MQSLLGRQTSRGLATHLPPISDIDDMFSDMVQRALSLGLDKSLEHLGSLPLRVATCCSGTESPLLALTMISDALQHSGASPIHFEHLFSAEIVPFKQAFIERNFKPGIIFRDIREVTTAINDDNPTGTTVFGAQKAIPGKVDLLIAGTSCVDFSKLSCHQQELELSGDGESSQTFYAVLNYANKFRPKIVIIENVKNAKWTKMLAEYEKIGYATAGVFVDSKDYYIPQTRQRGYMVCFDTAYPDARQAALKWQDIMSDLKRQASSPVTAFLLPPDKIQQRSDAFSAPLRDVEWVKCKVEQMRYRESQRLGHARPFTKWQESGAVSVPENGSASWYRSQTERVKDTIDCSILRKALSNHGEYDARYKTRIFNLSQNPFRATDSGPFGISTCITPNGIFFVSDAGRVLAAEEALQLQGLPLDRISLSTETSAELHDLAGNAMTSTVVGSAILSALICGYQAIEVPTTAPVSNVAKPFLRSFRDLSVDHVARTEHHADELQHHVPSTNLSHFTMDDINDQSAFQTKSMCTLTQMAQACRRQCICEIGFHRTTNAIRRCLACNHTACVRCAGNPQHEYDQATYYTSESDSPATFARTLRECLPLHFTFRSRSGLQPSVSPCDEQSVQYTELITNALRQAFSIGQTRRTNTWTTSFDAPGARLKLCFSQGLVAWYLFICPSRSLTADSSLRTSLDRPVARCLAPDGIGTTDLWEIRHEQRSIALHIYGSGLRVPSWWARCSLPDYKYHTVWQELEFSVEEHLDNTLQAICGRYQHFSKCGTANESLYIKRSEGCRPIYLFRDPARTGPPDLDCFVFAYDKESIEYDEVRSILARVEPQWAPWQTAAAAGEREDTVTAWHRPIASMDVWAATDLHLVPAFVNAKVELTENLDLSTACDSSHVLARCRLPPSAPIPDRPDQRLKGTCSRWATELFKRHMPDSSWTLFNQDVSKPCPTCAPARSHISWRLTKEATIEAVEDQETAATFERSLKNRPTGFYLEQSCGMVRLHVNVMSLAHRACASLPAPATKVECRLRECHQATRFTFRPFQLQTSVDGQQTIQPTSMSCTLYPVQRLMLAWMQKQEEGVDMLLDASCDASIPEHDWTLEVRAHTRLTIRGGICADHPGFGKTITSLALIATESIKAQQAYHMRHQAHSAAFIATNATLIVSPQSLVRQWADEVRDKMQTVESQNLIVIASLTDLEQLTIQNIKNAKIVLVNRLMLVDEGYLRRLAAFAGTPLPSSYTGHTFKKWLSHVHDCVGAHAQLLEQSTPESLRAYVEARYMATVDHARHLDESLSSWQKPSDDTKACKKSKALSAADSRGLYVPLLQMFYFSRLVVDEFHDLSAAEHASISSMQADKRWALSATPKMNDMLDISRMAALIGVPLPYGSLSTQTMKLANLRSLQKDMTVFERFDAMRETPSDTAHALMYEMDKLFLQTFVRRNIMDFVELPVEQHVVKVALDLDHYVLYHELSSRLYWQGMMLRKVKSTESNSDKRFFVATKGLNSAEEALSLYAAQGYREDRNLYALVQCASSECSDARQKLADAILVAQQSISHITDAVEVSMMLDELDDQQLQGYVHGLIRSPSETHLVPQKRPHATDELEDEDDSMEAHPQQLAKRDIQKVNIALMSSFKRLLTVTRSFRYLQNCLIYTDMSCYRSAGKLGSLLDHGRTLAVSALCGHVICENCHKQHRQEYREHCAAPGCDAFVLDEGLLWNNVISESAQARVGGKIAAVVDLVATIAKNQEQAVVFVEGSTQLKNLGQALSQATLKHRAVRAVSSASQHVAAFQQQKDITAILLNASDETAAGLNLQVANHVIFMSPLLRTTRYSYDATMAQAIGRVKRHGQVKDIHVYRIYALHTIDAEILENREPRLGVRSEQANGLTACSRGLTDEDQ